jgi:hypothetical protein
VPVPSPSQLNRPRRRYRPPITSTQAALRRRRSVGVEPPPPPERVAQGGGGPPPGGVARHPLGSPCPPRGREAPWPEGQFQRVSERHFRPPTRSLDQAEFASVSRRSLLPRIHPSPDFFPINPIRSPPPPLLPSPGGRKSHRSGGWSPGNAIPDGLWTSVSHCENLHHSWVICLCES